MTNEENFGILPTQRLDFKVISQTDSDLIYKLRSDEAVVRYTGIPKYERKEQAVAYVDRIIGSMKLNECVLWRIALIDSGIPVGSICLWNYSEDRKVAEIGYDLLPVFWGRGYVTEAIEAVLKVAFDTLGFEAVTAVPRGENVGSNRVLIKCGFEALEDFYEDGHLMKKYIKEVAK